MRLDFNKGIHSLNITTVKELTHGSRPNVQRPATVN
jgi:hypothetical protein